ncbi:MAG: sulfurtransferase TusA family protein [Thermoproteota archaeon]|nr:sulfurtransferase TusA family protein [Thermoproteota archaeon]
MKIDYCLFPEGFLYDLENFVWIKDDNPNSASLPKKFTVGITPILASLAGRFTKVKLKPVGTVVEKGKSIGSVESVRHFGIARSPIGGKIIEVNDNLHTNPKLANDFPYESGWFVKMETYLIVPSELSSLKTVEDCQDDIRKIMEKLHVRCFAAFPDYQMFEIGVECAATLTKLGELVSKIQSGDVVHLVSDDTSADLEMIRWSEETGQQLLEMRKEGNLFHFIVKKVK